CIHGLDQSPRRRLVVEESYLVAKGVFDRRRAIQIQHVFLDYEFTATRDLDACALSRWRRRIRSPVHMPNKVTPNQRLAEKRRRDRVSVTKQDRGGWSIVSRRRHEF